MSSTKDIFVLNVLEKYFPELTEEQKTQFLRLGESFTEWNAQINLVSRKDIDEFYTRHVLHSLAIAKAMKLADGSAIELKEIYSATIPLDKREGAYNWLRENDLGDLIKNEITVSFGRGEDNKASEYANLAKGNGFEPTQKLKVEPMTLKALFRERSEKNEELPSEHFNLFKGNKTKITRSK